MKRLTKKIIPLIMAMFVLSSCESRYRTRFYTEFTDNRYNISSVYGKKYIDYPQCFLENVTYGFKSFSWLSTITITVPESVYVEQYDDNLKIDSIGLTAYPLREGEIVFKYQETLTDDLKNFITESFFSITILYEGDYYPIYIENISFFFKISDNEYERVFPVNQNITQYHPSLETSS